MSGRWPTDRSQADAGDRRGQSEVIGVVLLLGIASIGITGVVLFGDRAVSDLQSQSELEGVEQAMTVFDSRAALVALGEANTQTVPMAQTSEGGYSIHPASDAGTDPKSGSITITHLDYDGAGTDEILHDGGLGSVVYETGGTEVAYQGGGVWKKSETGEARMISPPELHYQGSTLTLPIIQTGGSGGGGGATSATIREGASSTPVFPNASATYPNGDPYRNSIQNGEIEITIESEYAAGWAEYFVQRTGGELCPSGTMPTETSDCTIGLDGTTVELIITSLGTQGPFPMPPDESFLSVDGWKDDHPSFANDPYESALDPFTIALRPDDSDSANFANLQWSLYVKEGSQEFGIHLRRQSGKDCSNLPVVSATIYYTDDSGDTYQGWYDPDAFTGECGDYNGDGDQEIRLVANLAGTNDLEYQSLSKSQVGDEISISGATFTDPVTFDQHGGDVTADGSDPTYSAGEYERMDKLMDHYFTSLGPSFSLVVDDKNSDTVSEDASRGVIKYPTTENSITYLHVTENEIDVDFE